MTLDNLFQGILVDPFDDALRVMYADCCEEAGQTERAEFIRLQLHIATLERENLGWSYCSKCHTATDWHQYTKHCRGAVCKLRRREYLLSRRYCNWDWAPNVAGTGQYVYRRGFVDAITCSLQQWMDADCVCYGLSIENCRFCNDAETIPARGTRIVGNNPITSVRLTCRRPWQMGNNVRFGWALPGDFEEHGGWNLPSAIFECLPPTDEGLPKNQYRRWYRTERRALEALSSAALTWARRKAGLPALKFPATNFNGVSR